MALRKRQKLNSECNDNIVKRLYEANTEPRWYFNAYQAEQFLEMLHKDSVKNENDKLDKKIAICYKNPKKLDGEGNLNQWCFTKDEISGQMSAFVGLKDNWNEDMYISIHTYFLNNRKIKSLWKLNTLFLDLDYYKIEEYKDYTPEKLIEKMRKEGLFDSLEPSFFVDSGNGLYIFYLLDFLPAQAYKAWRKVEQALVKKFSSYNADAKATLGSQICRIPGTINPRTGRRVKIIWNQERIDVDASGLKWSSHNIRRYKLYDVIDILVEENFLKTKEEIEILREQSKERRKEKNNRQKTKAKEKNKVKDNSNLNFEYKSFKATNQARLNDFDVLAKTWRTEDNSLREFLCFVYRLHSLYLYRNTEMALNATLAFNSRFISPLDEEEVITATESAEVAFETYNKVKSLQRDLNKKKKNNEPIHNVQEQINSLSNQQYGLFTGCYLYTKEKLIKELYITRNEMIDLDLKNLLDEDINNIKRAEKKRLDYREKKEREKKEGKLSKREENKRAKEELRAKIKDLRAKGLKRADIISKLNITIDIYKKL